LAVAKGAAPVPGGKDVVALTRPALEAAPDQGQALVNEAISIAPNCARELQNLLNSVSPDLFPGGAAGFIGFPGLPGFIGGDPGGGGVRGEVAGQIRDELHLTASAAIAFDSQFMQEKTLLLKELTGQTVRWEQFAEGGQTFNEDGKTYALVPWWRLISITEENE